ncbi:MAG: hypothetical protein A2Y66_07705 [Nitrospirae bacterium RBG_13_41_22]|nr:MAG: hypothetical protein A2Y66_07705 [Nitrospirae bacterium RBG_13_41_22]
MQKSRITTITRRNIADAIIIAKLWYHGRMTEPDFLSRLFDLNKLPSKDYRYSNAYDDIHKHMVMNNDWEPDWVFTDNRLNLMHCDDEMYLRFLCETIHPAVRNSEDELQQLLSIYNKNLEADGFEIIQTDEISGKPIFSGRQKVIGQAHLAAKKFEIKKYLNTEYVNSKINTMNDAVNKDTDLAIGTAKELLETTCKSILKQKGVKPDPNWTLPKLVNKTTATLDFKPKEAEDPEKADKSIRQILGGISTIIHGVAELRNAYGTGHGKDADFKGLDTKYAKLLVGVVSEIAIIYLATNGETAELVE